MDSKQLLRVQLELECIGIDNGGCLVRIPGNVCDDIEYLLIAHYKPHYYDIYCRSDIDPHALTGIDPERAMKDESAVVQLLYQQMGLRQTDPIRRESWYWFAKPPTHKSPDVTVLGDTDETFDTFAVLHDWAWAARAWSIRRNDRAAEIAVETREAFRRRGYGRQVVAAWARYQFEVGRVATYNHRTYNLESKALAKSAGATLYAEVLSFH